MLSMPLHNFAIAVFKFRDNQLNTTKHTMGDSTRIPVEMSPSSSDLRKRLDRLKARLTVAKVSHDPIQGKETYLISALEQFRIANRRKLLLEDPILVLVEPYARPFFPTCSTCTNSWGSRTENVLNSNTSTRRDFLVPPSAELPTQLRNTSPIWSHDPTSTDERDGSRGFWVIDKSSGSPRSNSQSDIHPDNLNLLNQSRPFRNPIRMFRRDISEGRSGSDYMLGIPPLLEQAGWIDDYEASYGNEETRKDSSRWRTEKAQRDQIMTYSGRNDRDINPAWEAREQGFQAKKCPGPQCDCRKCLLRSVRLPEIWCDEFRVQKVLGVGAFGSAALLEVVCDKIGGISDQIGLEVGKVSSRLLKTAEEELTRDSLS